MAKPRHFFIAGVQKGGTSTLHDRLISHPEIVGAVCPVEKKAIKEVNFFDNLWHRGLDWYHSHYQDPDYVCLDSTPNYLCAMNAHARMHEHYPNAKLIISLRNPVKRAYSQFNHYTQDLPKSQNWDWYFPGEDFIRNIQAELSHSRRKWYGMVSRGLYIEQLEHLLQFYRRDQIHVVVLEQWIHDSEMTLKRIQEFLELQCYSLSPCVSHMRAYTVDKLDHAMKRELQDLYQPYNERLFDWLGYEIREWDDI